MAGYMIKENGEIKKDSCEIFARFIGFDNYFIKKFSKTINDETRNFYIICGYMNGENQYDHLKDGVFNHLLGKKTYNVPDENTLVMKIGTREIFDSMLDLFHKIASGKSRDKRNNLVLKWVKKYGFPYLYTQGAHNGFLDYNEKGIFEDEYEKVGYFYFDIDDFIRRLERLYRCFAYLAEHFGAGIGTSVDNRLGFSHPQYIEMETIIAVKTSLYFSGYNEVCLVQEVDSLMDLAKWQLMNLSVTPDVCVIKKCKCCGNMFVSERGNKKYCKYCNHKKYYAKLQRQKKKDGVNNGSDK